MNNIIEIYFLKKRQNSNIICTTFFALTLSLIRVKLTHSVFLLFLIWNLFLALLPLYFSNKIKVDFSFQKSNYKNLLQMIAWFLLVPNSFYILTDFVHLHYNISAQFLFDGFLILTYTLLGFYFGLYSFHSVYKLIINNYSRKIGIIFILIMSYLSAFGIYLGRVLRFNSWDVISDPISLFNSIFDCFFQIEILIFSMQLGSIILTSYIVYTQLLIKKSNYENISKH